MRKKYNEIFLAIIDNSTKTKCLYEVFLVNPTKENYEFILTLSSFTSDIDMFMDLGSSKYKPKKLASNSYAKIDFFDDEGQLDFTTAYNIALRDSKGNTRTVLEHISGRTIFMSEDSENRKNMRSLPVIKKPGIYLKLTNLKK